MGRMFLVFVVFFFINNSEGEKVRGTVNVADSKGFAFLGKFCFRDIPTSNFSHSSPAAGTVDIELTNKGDTESHYDLVIYDDQKSSWPQIYDTQLSCNEKIDINYRRSDRHITLRQYESYDKTIPIRQHIRPRWWWIYLTNCNDDNNNTEIDFELHFTQNTTSWLNIELGANDQGLNILYTIYLVIYVILFSVQLYAYYVYTIQQYIHQVIKLLTASIGLQLFAISFNFADWIIFTETGEHEIFFPIIASLCEIMSYSVFLLLLMVLAQGWTVSRFEVIYPKLLLGSVVCIALIQSVLYIWTLIGLDEQSTTYIYNTIPQKIYGALFIVIGLLFVVQCIISYRNETLSSKKNLYILLCAFFSFWFLWPLLRIVIGDHFKPWVRDTATQSISQTVNFVTYFIMMLLMWPKWAHQYFNLTMVDTQQSILDYATIDTSNVINYNVLEQDRL